MVLIFFHFQHHLPLNRVSPYNLYLIGTLAADVTVPIAVDDVHLERGECPPDPSTVFNCDDGSTVPIETVCNMKPDCPDGSDEKECGACDFENGECGWENYVETDYFWHRKDGNEPCEDCDCSGGDHTFQLDNTTSGFFMYLEHSDEGPNGKAIFAGPGVNSVHSSCMFKFWYVTRTAEAIIDVTMNHKEENVLVCRTRQTSNNWSQATCYIGRRADLFSLFVESLPTSIGDFIAVDDFTLEDCQFPRPAPDGCGEGRFTCGNGVGPGACVELKYLCDGTDDCGDFSDESSDQCDAFLPMCTFEDDCSWTDISGDFYWQV